MQKTTSSHPRASILVAFAAILLTAVLLYLPAFFGANARETARQQPMYKPGYYDIRTDKGASETMRAMRSRAAKTAADVADMRGKQVRGESALRAKVPSLKIEYSNELQIPEVIAADQTKSRASLMAQVRSTRADTLRGFAKENPDLIGVSGAEADALTTTADYTNPDGNLSFARLEQHINCIPVFQGEIKAGFDKRG